MVAAGDAGSPRSASPSRSSARSDRCCASPGVAVAPLPVAAARVPAAVREHPARAPRRLRGARGRALRRLATSRAARRPARVALALARARRAVPGARRRHLARARADPTPPCAVPPCSRVLTPGEVVLVLPFGGLGHGMLWQAEADFRFRQAGGYLRPDPPATLRARPGGRGAARAARRPRPPTCAHSCGAAARRRSSSTRPTSRLYASTLDPLGIKPERVGGLVVYRL